MHKSRFSRKKQKMYNMKGCSKSRKHRVVGGSSLAYTGKPIHTEPNPYFSYTGKGGSSCGLHKMASVPVNENASNPVYPNTGAPIVSNTIFNNASPQLGGGCSSCSAGLMVGGARHRSQCKCSKCKGAMKGGVMKGGNSGISYPNGLVGSAWGGNTSDWPGVNGISGDRNYISNNTYNNDVSREMVDLGANAPFLKGGNEGKGKRGRRQKGGTMSNFMGQDLINLGRQFQFGVGSAYNALSGHSAPTNPLPWKDQLIHNKPLNLYSI